jgi:hypothetical protein
LLFVVINPSHPHLRADVELRQRLAERDSRHWVLYLPEASSLGCFNEARNLSPLSAAAAPLHPSAAAAAAAREGLSISCVSLPERGGPTFPDTLPVLALCRCCCTQPCHSPLLCFARGCRAEVELRQRLAERDGRITQLKQDLADQGRQVDSLQRRVNELLSGSNNSGNMRTASGGLSRVGSGVGVVSGSGIGSFKGRKSPRSPRGEQPGSQPGSAAMGPLALPLEWGQEGEPGIPEAGRGIPSTEQIYGRLSSSSNGAAAAAAGVGGGMSSSGGSQIAAGLASAEKEYLAHQIAALRISLARRDADVARLEGKGRNRMDTGTTCLFVQRRWR